MLIHHSAEEYGYAAQKAATWATNKMNELVAEGQQKAIVTLERVQKEQPKDFIIPASELNFYAKNKQLMAFFGKDDKKNQAATPDFNFHKHALIQLGERCDMPNPRKVLDWLSSEEDIGDLAHILNRKYQTMKDSKSQTPRFLVRSVSPGSVGTDAREIRGFLSDRFKRLDSAPIVEAFIKAMQEWKAIPLEGRAFDTKFYLKIVLPFVLEPVPNEVMLWGAILKNSDYGDGRLELSGFVHRLRCTNLLISDDSFAKVHLGSRLSEELELSQKTYELETQYVVSAVGDVMKTIFNPDKVKGSMEAIQLLAKTNIDAEATLKAIRQKSKLTKAEAEEVAKLYSSAEIELLPPGQNAWRLSNAIALLAQNTELVAPERQLELEELAGEVAGMRKSVAVKQGDE